MNVSWDQLQADVPSFLASVFLYAKELGIDVSDLEIDHLGLRIRDPQDIARLRRELETVSVSNRAISNTIIHGRTITNYKLQSALAGEYEGRKLFIPCVELPDPKEPHHYPRDGWEHAEFVLPCNARTKEEMLAAFQAKFGTKLTGFTTNLPTLDPTQLPNPTVAFERQPGLALKFHPHSIEAVVLGRKLK